jgi:hypothetical protein
MSHVCEKCGSEKIIANLPMQDSMQPYGMAIQASVKVESNPESMVFKGAVKGSLFLDVCCDCGRAEIRVSNGQELWQAYIKAQR